MRALSIRFLPFEALVGFLCIATITGCSSEPGSSDPQIGSTAGATDPLPAAPPDVAAAADTVVFGNVASQASYDVAGDGVETVSVVRVQSVERGSVQSGDEILVITRGGATVDRIRGASDEARVVEGASGRFYLTGVPPERTELAREAVGDVAQPSTAAFRVAGGYAGFQIPRLAGALASCPDPFETPYDGYCRDGSPISHSPIQPWTSTSVIKYYINPANTGSGLTEDQIVRSIEAGVDTWNEEPSSWVRFEYMGKTTRTSANSGEIVFVFDALSCGGRGNTDSMIDGSNRVYGATICFNDTIAWSTTTLMHTTMHESGHAMGLGHVSDTAQIMYPTATDSVILGWGDRNFVNAVYHGAAIPYRADVNGDGNPDLVNFADQAVFPFLPVAIVSLWNPSTNGYSAPVVWNTNVGSSGESPMLGDVDGDHKTDVISFIRQGYGYVLVCKSTGSSFQACTQWHPFFGINAEHVDVGDFNGDHKDDIVTFAKGASATVYVALSDGTKFGTSSRWIVGFGHAGEVMAAADMNGDGCDDIVTMQNGVGSPQSWAVQVALSQACLASGKQNKFGTPTTWLSSFCGANKTPIAADGALFCFNNDGTGSTMAVVNSSKTGFNAPQSIWTQSPVFNQTIRPFNSGFGPFIGWYEHGTRANVYGRFAGSTTTWLSGFAYGPCPWNGVSGVCP